ncbi:hypothetical protein D3C80_1584890 [compost metagenome]
MPRWWRPPKALPVRVEVVRPDVALIDTEPPGRDVLEQVAEQIISMSKLLG